MGRFNGKTERFCTECLMWTELKDEESSDDLFTCPHCRKVQRIARCNRCGYEWKLHRASYPANCPKCKSPYYNTKRIQDRTKIARKYNETEASE